MPAKKTSASKKKSEPEAPDWTEAAAKTDMPSIAISDEFHAPISEKQTPAGAGRNASFWRIVWMIVGLIVVASAYLFLTHEGPV